MLHPQRLVILEAVIAAGSVNSAARNLNYSPATISQHLKGLARETGLILFTKEGRGIVPTDVAVQLAEHARTVLADLDRLDRAVSDLKQGPTANLAIACFSSVAKAWLPGVVHAVRQHFPNVTVEISLNEPHDGHGRRSPDVDIRNEASARASEARIDGYDRHPLTTEEFFVVLPPEHRLTDSTTIFLGELHGEPWIDHDIYDSPTGQIITNACQAAGFTPEYVSRLDDHHAAVALVEAGLGLTVLPELALIDLDTSLTIRPLRHPAIQRRIVAHTSRDHRRREIVDVALDSLRAQAGPSSAPRGSAQSG